MNDFNRIISKLPKSELHIHLRGAIPIQIFSELLDKYHSDWNNESTVYKERFIEKSESIRKIMSVDSFTIDCIKELFNYSTFEQFLTTFSFTGYFIRSIEDFKKLVIGVLEYLKQQNVVYAEITLSITGYLKCGITLKDIKGCIESTSEYPGIRVRWIIDLVRDYGRDAALNLLKEVTALKCKNIVGITLGGNEVLYPNSDFSEVYMRAKNAGLHCTVHAGEGRGPDSIWEAISTLGVERIGHGVRAIEDNELVKYLAENRIPLEICPTSNIKTGIFKQHKEHPIWHLYDKGVQVTVNSDDPAFFNTTLNQEYISVYDNEARFNSIIDIIKNGFTYSFLSDKEKNGYLASFNKQLKSVIN